MVPVIRSADRRIRSADRRIRSASPSITERGETIGSGISPRGLQAGRLCPRGTEAGSVRRWLPRSVSTEPPSAFGISPRAAGGEGIGAASSPAEWRERGAGRPIAGFGRPLLVADRGERGSGRRREDSWMDRSPTAGVLAAGQVGEGWEPAPQSLRDSSPSGGAIRIGLLRVGDSRAGHFGSRTARSVRRWLPRIR